MECCSISSFPWQLWLIIHLCPFWLSDASMWFVPLRILTSPENVCAIAVLYEAKLCCWDNDVFPDGPKTPVCSAQFVRVIISILFPARNSWVWWAIPPKTDLTRTSKMQDAGWRNTTGSIALWLFSIVMENGRFIDGLPIKNCDFPWLC